MSPPAAPHTPLAERLRPRTLADVIGQQHMLGEGMALRLAFESGQPHSCILWGPPGSGKTTLAKIIGNSYECEFVDHPLRPRPLRHETHVDLVARHLVSQLGYNNVCDTIADRKHSWNGMGPCDSSYLPLGVYSPSGLDV